jgi:hypothetical protein
MPPLNHIIPDDEPAEPPRLASIAATLKAAFHASQQGK